MIDKNLHWVVQYKGGIGKTLIAQILCENLRNTLPINVEVMNQGLGSVKALNAIEAAKSDKFITEEDIEDAIEKAINSPVENIVIDTGTGCLGPALAVLKKIKQPVNLHLALCGGQSLESTVMGMSKILDDLPNHFAYVWINSFFGLVQYEGKSFEKTGAYANYEQRFSGLIKLPEFSEFFCQDISKMLALGMTFGEGVKSDEFSVLQRSRLFRARKIFSEAMKAANL